MKQPVLLLVLLLLAACTHTVKDHPTDVAGDAAPESACGVGQDCDAWEAKDTAEAEAQGKDAEVLDVPEVPDTLPDSDTVTDVTPDAEAKTDTEPETDTVSPLGNTWVAWPVSTPGLMTGGDLVLRPLGPPGQPSGTSQGGELRLR